MSLSAESLALSQTIADDLGPQNDAALLKGPIRPALMSGMISAPGKLKATIIHWFTEYFSVD